MRDEEPVRYYRAREVKPTYRPLFSHVVIAALIWLCAFVVVFVVLLGHSRAADLKIPKDRKASVLACTPLTPFGEQCKWIPYSHKAPAVGSQAIGVSPIIKE